MKRRLWIIALVAVGIFGIISFAKREPPTAAAEEEAAEEEANAGLANRRDSLTMFWRVYRQASDLRMSGKFEQAADHYDRALRLNPSHEDALYYLGNMYLQLGEYTSAEAAWERLADVSPHSTRAHKRLGDLRFCYPESPLFDMDAADASYRRALEINKEETGPVMRVGLLLLAKGDLKGAAENLSAVIASNFKSVPAHYFLGYTSWKAGDERRAAELFKAALTLVDEEVKSTDPVAGEGDTRQGSRPLTADELGCSALESHVQAFRASAASPDMRASYAGLDAYLRSLR